MPAENTVDIAVFARAPVPGQAKTRLIPRLGAAGAAWLQRQRESARDVGFVIGGAYGLAPAVRDRAAVRLAVAPWTLPHELARLVLAEQLYRAGTLVRGEPYHKP